MKKPLKTGWKWKRWKSHHTIGKHCSSDCLLEKSWWVGLETRTDHCRTPTWRIPGNYLTHQRVTLLARLNTRCCWHMQGWMPEVLLGFDLRLMTNLMVVLVSTQHWSKKSVMQNNWDIHRIIEARWLCSLFLNIFHQSSDTMCVIVSHENIIKMRKLIVLHWTLVIYRLYTILNTYLPI